jgi:hypothetical protein
MRKNEGEHRILKNKFLDMTANSMQFGIRRRVEFTLLNL